MISEPVSPGRSPTYQSLITILDRSRQHLSLALAAAACTVALTLSLPAGAAAGICAPPGNSEINQYVEVVPGVGCNRPTSGPGSGNSGHGGGHLSAGTSRQLAAAGGAGRAVQQLVASSGTGSSGGRHLGSRGASQMSPKQRSAVSTGATGRSPLSALLHPILTGSAPGGLGLLLPVLLACILALMVLAALLRRRRLTS